MVGSQAAGCESSSAIDTVPKENVNGPVVSLHSLLRLHDDFDSSVAVTAPALQMSKPSMSASVMRASAKRPSSIRLAGAPCSSKVPKGATMRSRLTANCTSGGVASTTQELDAASH